MPAVVNQEWLNQNSLRAYPFQENSTRHPVLSDGTLLSNFEVPNYFIVDFVLTVPSFEDISVYMSQLSVAGGILNVVFSKANDSTIITSISINIKDHVANTAYPVYGIKDFEDARGWIVFGDLRNLSTDLPDGIYSFTPDQTLLEPAVIRPMLRGVRSICVENNGVVSRKLYGNIKLIAGENIRLEYDASQNGIWVHADPNSGYKDPGDCEGEDKPVETINGIPFKNVSIVGDGECVDVKVEGDKIIISDICSKPCCGCPELEFISNTIKLLESNINKVENYAQTLSAKVDEFVTKYILTITT